MQIGQRKRWGFKAAENATLWEHSKPGKGAKVIGRVLGKSSSSIWSHDVQPVDLQLDLIPAHGDQRRNSQAVPVARQNERPIAVTTGGRCFQQQILAP